MTDYTTLIPADAVTDANAARVQPWPKKLPMGEVSLKTWQSLAWCDASGRLHPDVTVYAHPTRTTKFRGEEREEDPELVLAHAEAGGVPIVNGGDAWVRITGIDGDAHFNKGEDRTLGLGMVCEDELADAMANYQRALVAASVAARHVLWPDKPEETPAQRAKNIDKTAQRAAGAVHWKDCRRKEGKTPTRDEDDPAIARRPHEDEYAGSIKLGIPYEYVTTVRGGLAKLEPFFKDFEAHRRGEERMLQRDDIGFGSRALLRWTCYGISFAKTILPFAKWKVLAGLIAPPPRRDNTRLLNEMAAAAPPLPDDPVPEPEPEPDFGEPEPKRIRVE